MPSREINLPESRHSNASKKRKIDAFRLSPKSLESISPGRISKSGAGPGSRRPQFKEKEPTDTSNPNSQYSVPNTPTKKVNSEFNSDDDEGGIGLRHVQPDNGIIGSLLSMLPQLGAPKPADSSKRVEKEPEVILTGSSRYSPSAQQSITPGIIQTAGPTTASEDTLNASSSIYSTHTGHSKEEGSTSSMDRSSLLQSIHSAQEESISWNREEMEKEIQNHLEPQISSLGQIPPPISSASSSSLGSLGASSAENADKESVDKDISYPYETRYETSEEKTTTISNNSDQEDTTSYVLPPPTWTKSQHKLMKMLANDFDLVPSTLGDFLSAQRIPLNLSLLDSSKASLINYALASYVVARKKRHGTSPSTIPKSHQSLSATPESDEVFLFKLWNSNKPHIEATSFNTELHIGPWYDLISIIGREWVTYIILHCHVFRPWNVSKTQSANRTTAWDGQWLHLVGHLQWDKRKGWNYGAQKRNQKDALCLTKADIMYKKRPLNREFQFPDLPAEQLLPFPETFWKLALKAQTKLGQYRTVLAKQRIPAPTPRSKTHRWIEQKDVASYVFRRAQKLLPIGILGSKNNWNSFRQAVLVFVRTTGFAKISVKLLIKGIKLSEIPWIRASRYGNNNTEMLRIFEHCICWLFNHIVKPLLSHHFYITEMSGKPGSIYYYEQSIWLREFDQPTRSNMLKRHYNSGKSNSNNAVNGTGQQAVTPPVSRMSSNNGLNATYHSPANDFSLPYGTGERWRVVPKRDGSTRPIINLKDLNKTLKNAHLILHNAMEPLPSRLDSWHSWITRLYEYRNRVTNEGKLKRDFYAVKLDISGCYDNANVDKVKQLVLCKLDHGKNVYRIQTIYRYMINSGKFNTRDDVKLLPELPANETLTMSSTGSINDRRRSAQKRFSYTSRSPDIGTSIITETSRSRFFQGDEVLADTNKLFNNLNVQMSRQRSMPFTQGIPQGSMCSLDLCNILLDDLVIEQLSQFSSDSESLLLRYVDDFLFVTTNHELALEFQNTMLKGFETEYGVTCNISKLISNIASSKREKIQFLGYDFSTETLDVFPRSIPLNFIPDSKTIPGLRNKLNREMDYFLSGLRSFKRSGETPPLKLVRETACMFGAVIYSRIKAFSQILSTKQDTELSRAETYHRVLNRYIMPLVPAEHHQIRRIIKQSYNRQKQQERRRSG